MKNLIIDISPLAYKCLYSKLDDIKMIGINVLRSNLLGHILFSTERVNPNKVFVCFDCNGKNWRKEKYDFYKAHRKEAREKQDVNWEEFYGFLNSFYDELKDNFPFISLKHNKLEADDIAAYLVRRYSNDTNVILTNDSDYLQLLKYKNVEILDSKTGKKKTHDSPKKFLELKILTGDSSDNIPPVQAGTGPVKAEKLIDEDKLTELLEKKDADGNPCEFRRNYNRNKELIDLDNTPESLLMSLENLVDDYKLIDTKNLTNYLREHTLRDLFSNISTIRRNLTKLVQVNGNHAG